MDNPSQPNPKKIYIGNLPYSVDETQLRDLCSPFGEIVDVKLITDYATGRSKGFAFVEFATEEAATPAIEALNGTELDGRALMVTLARPQQPRENRSFQGGGGYNRDNRRPFDRSHRGGSSGGGGRY